AYRAAGDPAGTTRSDAVLKIGEGPYDKTLGDVSRHWGRYSRSVVDPANDLDLWTEQEYAAAPVGQGVDSGRWGIWWGRLGLSLGPTAVTIVSMQASASSDDGLGAAVVRFSMTIAAALLTCAALLSATRRS